MEQVSITIKPYASEIESARAGTAVAALLARVDDEEIGCAPRRRAPRPPAGKRRDKTRDLPTARGDEWILVVDDDPTLVDVCSQMLAHLGYEVITATGGAEALEIFRTHAGLFDLVISDINMPGMNGAELTRELLAIRPGLPVLLYSGYCRWMDAGQALALGAGAFRLKPMPIAEMATCVRQLIDKAA